MNKTKASLFSSLLLTLFIFSSEASAVEQTICYSNNGNSSCKLASLGDGSNLDSGQCKGATLKEMNKRGWRLILIGPEVGSCTGGFTMLFEKK